MRSCVLRADLISGFFHSFGQEIVLSLSPKKKKNRNAREKRKKKNNKKKKKKEKKKNKIIF